MSKGHRSEVPELYCVFASKTLQWDGPSEGVSFAASDNLRWRAHKKGWPGNSAVSLFEMCDSVLLYDRTGSYKSLTSLVSLIFLEVLNETSCEVLSLLLPN